MTLPPQTVTVKCPQCQQIYIDWYVPPVGVQTADSHKPSTVCSKCGHRSVLDDFSEQAGVFQQVVTP